MKTFAVSLSSRFILFYYSITDALATQAQKDAATMKDIDRDCDFVTSSTFQRDSIPR